MAEIVFGAAMSHSPMMNLPLPKDHAKVESFKAAMATLERQIHDAAPDVVVIFGPDHFRTLFYDMMPAFVIGTGLLEGWGDWDTIRGPFTTNGVLAAHIVQSTMAAGFDAAFSHAIKVDHGVTQPLQLLGLTALPIVPIVINAAGPPLPSPSRCHAFGAAIGAAIRSWSEEARVAILASGGLSHDPPAPSPENQLHGRSNGFAGSRERETRLMNRAETLEARINEPWDRMVLDHFTRGSVAELAKGLTTESIFTDAGNGGQELRTWIAAAAALEDRKMNVLYYEPIPALVTGMGIVTT
jgi:2,3-dihydroxyphenylpropionate 1,2-dioxygenase